MDDLDSILRHEYMEYEALQAFEAAIPIYYIRLAVEVLEPLKLSLFQLYFLHALALGVTTLDAIAHLLGVTQRDLAAPGASLLKNGYIEQRQALPGGNGPAIDLTSAGRTALSEQGPPPVPKRKTGSFHFNTLTWSALPAQENTWAVEQMGKEGLYLLPPKSNERPSMGDFTEKEVTNALSGVAAFQDNEIIALLELQKRTLEYLAPVSVVVLRHRETDEKRVVVYHNGVQMRQESMAVQRLFENGKLTIPGDATSLKTRGLDVPISLPPPVADAAHSLVQNEFTIQDIELQLQEQEGFRTATQNERERKELTTRIADLNEELQVKRDENTAFRRTLEQNRVVFLRTEQHRSFLEKALREAREEIIIISPWMNRRACDDALCRLVGDALKRGVQIRIGYGIGNERDPAEVARNRASVNAVRTEFQRFVPPHSASLLDMRKTAGTHQKILVCDRLFAITGSFNWLSYAGQLDTGYRSETGTLFQSLPQVTELAAIAFDAWNSA